MFDREWTQQVVKQQPYAAGQNLTFWTLCHAQMSFWWTNNNDFWQALIWSNFMQKNLKI